MGGAGHNRNGSRARGKDPRRWIENGQNMLRRQGRANFKGIAHFMSNIVRSTIYSYFQLHIWLLRADFQYWMCVTVLEIRRF